MNTTTEPQADAEAGAEIVTLESLLAKVPAMGADQTTALKRAQTQLTIMQGLKIEDQTGLELARDDVQGIKAIWRQIEERRVAVTGPLNAALDFANGVYQPALKLLKAAETAGKTAIGKYLDEEEAKAQRIRAEQERLQREAEARAAEQARLAREAAEAESRRLAEQQRALEAEAAAAQSAGDQATADAARADAAMVIEAQARVVESAEAAATAIELSAVSAVAVAPVAATAKSVGLSSAKDWDVEVVDLVALVQYAAANPAILASLVCANDRGIKATVKAAKGATNIPGLKVTPKRVIRA